MTREGLKQDMLVAMSEHHSGNAAEAQRIVDAILAAIEAAGVRLVQVKLPARLQYVGAAYLAREGATGVTPEAFAGAFEEVALDLAASPYAPQKDETK